MRSSSGLGFGIDLLLETKWVLYVYFRAMPVQKGLVMLFWGFIIGLIGFILAIGTVEFGG